jgi:hypothetical protein
MTRQMPPKRDALQEQLLDQCAFGFGDALGVEDELAATSFTPMILFAVMGMAGSFNVQYPAPWAAEVVHGSDSLK